MLAREAS
jgi:hypothetical protein